MSTLIITTSTKLASLSLYDNDNMLGNINVNVKRTHSSYIIDQISSLLSWSGIKIENIQNVIVSIGPGSFTGVRIAISVIKGMFVGRNVKIYEVNELDALGYQGNMIYMDKVIAMIDSNKEKIYYGKYENGKRIGQLLVGKLDDVISLVKNEEYKLIGDAVISYSEKLEENGIKIPIADTFLRINSGIFYAMYKDNLLKEVDLFNLVPDYLEKSQAEKEKNGNI
ncbi:tRNA (adenosine(37)-N6)-threonylcarbamoyltransferase complex dimerization subunit type 1 TsaB [Streptobacillus moniliformis]|uniref:Peptidase M22 glycoprotease n=1 Tax=Streptobacillus moniliformis (strain ATCC 14647 / DSM 12112 / NCTC 10651 / 9901) TaxID=519441 RepID=D1AW95_STRM9|nr:tRNA (adenosine(37)-N6)-threonylcarbamoyltransferase complex dimerization subunit type 1 TsaB [Streptobacillus moniliformis]ACZ00571.1 peptidase M22 glycoprotease [Streptobacillus moniliformis DSM 12112]QXW65336.1 tRNA (adenosine(37)-N6)-threonylcarbamoyltransferase complex dimerization subunit type 1 TsaB [Streptobacillus moniliformis]SQA14310.1 universal bacterial protein YeaZ [Streptobacillus moniliformis]